MLLSENQTKVLGFISEFIRSNGIAPTLREVGAGTGLSFVGVRQIMIVLEHRGFLKRLYRKPRAVSVLRMPEAA